MQSYEHAGLWQYKRHPNPLGTPSPEPRSSNGERSCNGGVRRRRRRRRLATASAWAAPPLTLRALRTKASALMSIRSFCRRRRGARAATAAVLPMARAKRRRSASMPEGRPPLSTRSCLPRSRRRSMTSAVSTRRPGAAVVSRPAVCRPTMERRRRATRMMRTSRFEHNERRRRGHNGQPVVCDANVCADGQHRYRSAGDLAARRKADRGRMPCCGHNARERTRARAGVGGTQARRETCICSNDESTCRDGTADADGWGHGARRHAEFGVVRRCQVTVQ